MFMLNSKSKTIYCCLCFFTEHVDAEWGAQPCPLLAGSFLLWCVWWCTFLHWLDKTLPFAGCVTLCR